MSVLRVSPPRRLLRAAGVLVAGLALSSSSLLSGSAPAAPADDPARPVTLSGAGAFAELKVTVGQTANLVNQVDTVTWTGGAPTQAPGNFDIDYLQIMQCWSRSAEVKPDRTNCQFGGLRPQTSGAYTYRRQLTYGKNLVDPAEQPPVPPDGPNVSVPFTPVGNQTGPQGRFFDANSSNEVPFARTRVDGTGVSYFETQTAQQAPGLGCGQHETSPEGDTYVPACWLVVVPRNDREVDGSQRSPSQPLDSSPLSQTNWDQRIVFPLSFQPTGLSCPLSAQEEQLTGHENFTTAVSSWQPTLCARGATYNYSQVSDDTARRVLVSDTPGLDFVGRALDPAVVREDAPPVYAPVAVSGLTFALNLDKNFTDAATPEEVTQAGQRVGNMNLTPRVVVKLLTQSYQFGGQYDGGPEPGLKNNAPTLIADPDFLKDNPSFVHQQPSLPDALVPFAPADAIAALWNWINSDKDARAFLDGAPDPYGMTVNPSYQGLATGLDRLPKSDLRCQILSSSLADLLYCTLDAHPYAADFRDATRSASRGDTLQATGISNSSTPGVKPTLTKGALQPSGRRALMALADTGTAARYALPMARLRNASGAFVPPDQAGLAAGLAAMKPTGPGGLLQADPTSRDPAAYPLTQVTYAATAPAKLTKTQGSDFAAFLRYAAADGQTVGLNPGQLPPGYLPLPSSLRQQSLATADVVQQTAAVPVTVDDGTQQSPTVLSPSSGSRALASAPSSSGVASGAPTTTPTSGSRATSGPSARATATTSATAAPSAAAPSAIPQPAGVDSTPLGVDSSAAAPPAGAAPSIGTPAPAAPAPPAAGARVSALRLRTPGTPMSSSPYAFLAALVALLLAGLSGPLLLRRGRAASHPGA